MKQDGCAFCFYENNKETNFALKVSKFYNRSLSIKSLYRLINAVWKYGAVYVRVPYRNTIALGVRNATLSFTILSFGGVDNDKLKLNALKCEYHCRDLMADLLRTLKNR